MSAGGKFFVAIGLAILGAVVSAVVGFILSKGCKGGNGEERVKAVVLDWVDAWEEKDFDRQMGHCTSDFFYTDNKGTYYNREKYENHKKMLWGRYETIKVGLKNLEVYVKGSEARVEYIQTYQGTAYQGAGASYYSKGEEVLYLRKYGNRWLIYQEHFQKF